METSIKHLLNSIDFTKATYMLLSDGENDSVKAEKLIKTLGECEVTKIPPVFTYGDILNNIRRITLAYPMLTVISSCISKQIIGYEAIEEYVRQVTSKKYLVVWLALDYKLSPSIVSKIAELDFFPIDVEFYH
jgi:hypothetical protein